MACECITEMDALLAGKNTRLGVTLIFSSPARVVVTLETETVTKKRGARPVAVIPTHCPFCGVKYEAAADAAFAELAGA